MPLTDLQIKRFSPSEKPYKRADGGGLFIQVTPKGSKLWRMSYRFEGKQKLLSLGAQIFALAVKADVNQNAQC
jgi:Arm domain-containing DNA-binding protein